MQLSPDHGSIDKAIEELRLALTATALQNIVAQRRRSHRELGTLRRRLQLAKARLIVEEASVD